MRVTLVLLFVSETCSGFLTGPVNNNPGRCIWYGQCGPGFNQGTHLNCPATNATRDALLMKSAHGLKILKQYCPNIYRGDDNTRTCCSESQLIDLESSFVLPKQLLSRCPSCMENFFNCFCQMTCGLNQADFMWPDMGAMYPPGYHYTPKGIPAVTVLLAREYTEGLFNSCKDVSLPAANDKAISVLCGTAAKHCTASKLFHYLGNTGNGKTSIPIKYVIQDHNMTMPDNITLSPLVGKNRPCNATSNSSKSCRVCSCRDCTASCCQGQDPYFQFDPKDHHDYFHSQFKPSFRRSQIVISRPGNDSKVRHSYPPPSTDYLNFTALFDLHFMHQVLDFQRNLSSIPASYNGTTFTFQDICMKPSAPLSQSCALESVLQYWQNNATNLDKVAWDEYQFFELADYLDHFLRCTNNPYGILDATKLNMSCRADYGEAMKPMNILNGFDGVNYQNATSFVISYYLKTTNDEQRSRADAWDEAIRKYMCTCPTTNMSIALWP